MNTLGPRGVQISEITEHNRKLYNKLLKKEVWSILFRFACCAIRFLVKRIIDSFG